MASFHCKGKWSVGADSTVISYFCVSCVLLSVKLSVSAVHTSIASLSDPASKKKAADCSKRCFPSREKAFFNAAFRQRSSLKLFLKNWVIFSSCWDLREEKPHSSDSHDGFVRSSIEMKSNSIQNNVFRKNVLPEEPPQDSFLLHGQVEQSRI